jgi:hypothetical protein
MKRKRRSHPSLLHTPPGHSHLLINRSQSEFYLPLLNLTWGFISIESQFGPFFESTQNPPLEHFMYNLKTEFQNK